VRSMHAYILATVIRMWKTIQSYFFAACS